MGEEDLVLEEMEMELEMEKGCEELSVGRWERFLPRLCLRVLLVEGDDSTRQIVAALLKKCNFKVTTVSDGLKAWELLKEKPHSIDLILTEVQLPSISGFCLLTMIMGHEKCKNIPVIMMSSHDSVSIVFKCMMRGAADFLVKPVRKNELRNLWQHVWRRQTLTSPQHGCQDGGLKLGASSKNDAMSSHSSDCVASVQKNKECSEKRSDSQSSCTKPDIEAESARLNDVQDLLQPKCCSSLTVDSTLHECEEPVKLGRKLLHESKAEGDEIMTPASDRKDSDRVNENGHFIGKQDRIVPCREAIDLIGTIENQSHCNHQHTEDSAVGGDFSDVNRLPNKKENLCKFSSAPLLELSLRRFCPSGIQEIEESHYLNHSNSSAFSRYNSRTVQHAFLSSTSFPAPQDCTDNTIKPPSNQGAGNDMDTLECNEVAPNNMEEDSPPVTDPSTQDNMVRSCPKLGLISVPIPFSGMPLDGLHSSYGTLPQHMFYTYPTGAPGPPPWSTHSMSPQEAFYVNSFHQSIPKTLNPEKDHHPCDKNVDKSGYQSGTTQERNLESREDPEHIPSAPAESGSSNLCNGSSGNQKSSGSGSVCNESNRNISAAATPVATSESGNDECIFTTDQVRSIDCQHVSRREAALTKFRLKRKDRCYEKKVRYQSRKKLAEERPRVKGQFVRRVQPDSHQPSAELDCCF
ncbi:hypothetical protein MRB53_025796 [Persea americana]|uniref:Uncharacterized protein n=1 Tax=Persea americana TaxID=3435 RepID=A0ACC2LG79_PERAE|nr:hypothetical protein MRB53_025796 [Persea americana]|eukprot:TRINITY_DN6863_c0_g3_i2.p1 TRINITY_DN6863_c0_g3~~TRINITY_DN6863_c0_g3_i2.p1  ORF type:complete len:690 (+),score=143.72 TRINITY_DN6863_c0_g3_i2:364-2433(+)